MPLIGTANKERYAGYAYTQNVLNSFSLVTEGKLSKGQKVDAVLLRSFDIIPDGDATPIMGVWRLLGLVDNLDCVTESFLRLASAVDEEYRTVLREILNKAYGDILSSIDIRIITRNQLAETFKTRGYKPQTYGKMASLLIGLARAADLRPSEGESSPFLDEEPPPVLDEEPSDTESLPPVKDVSPIIEGLTPMPELPSSPKTNGTIHAPVNDSLVVKLLANFVKLHHQRNSANWTEASRAMWEDQLKLNDTMLEQALELMEEKKQ